MFRVTHNTATVLTLMGFHSEFVYLQSSIHSRLSYVSCDYQGIGEPQSAVAAAVDDISVFQKIFS